MPGVVPYCGTAPLPHELASRFNTDPVLIAALVALAAVHVLLLRRADRPVAAALAGWSMAAAALLSPLCALSVALFSARVTQHMILLLVAAPLIAVALPWRADARALWPATIAFFLALWFWHMPVPYAATFRSSAIYWAMHISLFGSGVWLWQGLLSRDRAFGAMALLAGFLTSLQMSLLGAVLTLAGHPLFAPHFFTTEAWGLSPLADQQLGGAVMWVPGCILFLGVGLRSFTTLWHAMEPETA